MTNGIEAIKITSFLQMASYESYVSVLQSLKLGMTEVEIANLLKEEMEKYDIRKYWYNIPIFVLIGSSRFLSLTSHEYKDKSPHHDVTLKEGSVVYIDFHPQDNVEGIWGDWNSMFVYQPRKDKDEEQIAFLEEMRTIQREGIEQITSFSTAEDVARYYMTVFEQHGITLCDVRSNVGHSMHKVAKLSSQRIFLEKGNNTPLGEGIYAIEPGGFRKKKSGEGIVVGRFEECIFIPHMGKPTLLGRQELLPLVVRN